MHRLIRSTFVAAGFGLIGTAAISQPVSSDTASLRPESSISFDGTSTVRGFTCNAAQLAATVVTDPAGAQAPAASLVRSAELTVPVARLYCSNGTMNGHMRKALKAEQHPDIGWRMTSYEVDGESVLIRGHLTIAGRSHAIELRGRGTLNQGVVRFRGTREIRMTDYGVTPPTLMLGTMRVHDTVNVRFDIALDL